MASGTGRPPGPGDVDDSTDPAHGRSDHTTAQKNGHPGHPQTQGKIERFHQTLKLWLAQQPPAATVVDLQAQLDRFRSLYNEQRPHRALDRITPGTAYRARPKAQPGGQDHGHYRIRYERISSDGKMGLRRAGRMHHLGIGTNHPRKRVLALADTVTVIELQTGEILSTHHIEPNRSYWRNQQRTPGRWPGVL